MGSPTFIVLTKPTPMREDPAPVLCWLDGDIVADQYETVVRNEVNSVVQVTVTFNVIPGGLVAIAPSEGVGDE